jgi:hypothetical protein
MVKKIDKIDHFLPFFQVIEYQWFANFAKFGCKFRGEIWRFERRELANLSTRFAVKPPGGRKIL